MKLSTISLKDLKFQKKNPKKTNKIRINMLKKILNTSKTRSRTVKRENQELKLTQR